MTDVWSSRSASTASSAIPPAARADASASASRPSSSMTSATAAAVAGSPPSGLAARSPGARLAGAGRGEGSSLHGSLRLVVTELNADLGEFADDGPGFSGGDLSPLKRGAKFRERQMSLAAPALNQLVQASRGCLIVASLRRGGRALRHETPPYSRARTGHAPSCTTGAAPSGFPGSAALGIVQRGHYL